MDEADKRLTGVEAHMDELPPFKRKAESSNLSGPTNFLSIIQNEAQSGNKSKSSRTQT